MALPVTITSSDDPSNTGGRNRPFRSSAGNIYVILLSASGPAISVVQDGDFLQIAVQMEEASTTSVDGVAYKATDPTSSFAIQDSGGQPTWTTDADDSELWFSRFNMANDTWDNVGISNDPDILIYDPGVTLDVSAVAIALRSDGDMIVLHQKFRHKFMGVDRPAVGIMVSNDNGLTWFGPFTTSATGTAVSHYVGAIVIPPNNSDQAHIFFIADDGSPTLLQRALSSADTPRTVRDTGFTVDSPLSVMSALAFTRGGSEMVHRSLKSMK